MGFIVFGINRDHQLFFGQPIFAGDQIPGELDGFGFEIIAEGEITEHFEKGMMAGGIADIIQIIMFATGADAFL